MTLTLAVVRGQTVANVPAALQLDRQEALIGRSAGADLCLPDAEKHISSRHCEIVYLDNNYWVIDRSTNGTLVNDTPLVPGLPHRIVSGEMIKIGGYEVMATLDGPANSNASLPGTTAIEDVLPRPEEGTPRTDAMLLLRHMVRGVIRIIDARSRAKLDLGLSRTMTALDGDNPLQRIRSADRALATLLMPPAPGFMSATRAIDEAFLDFQAHEVATMAGTQAALKRSIKLFSPAAIRARRESHGLFAVLFPAWRDAKLWRVYEQEFEQIVEGADPAFADVFVEEFLRKYNEHIALNRDRRRSERIEPPQ